MDEGINHFLWKAEFEYFEIYVVLDCFIVKEWELLWFFIKAFNKMGTVLNYASQEVFCKNSLKNQLCNLLKCKVL